MTRPAHSAAEGMEPDVLTAQEAADLLRINRETLYVLAGQRKIPHARLGRSLRFSRRAIFAWLTAGGQEM